MKPLTILLVAGSIMAAGCAGPQNAVPPASTVEAVLILPGFGRTPRAMSRLHRFLEDEGFRPIDWDYPSMRGRIQDHGRELQRTLMQLDRDPSISRIHLVGHSLGGIVIRHALSLDRPAKIGRVVLLAPPNRGSAAARKWSAVLGDTVPVLEELSDDPHSTVNALPIPQGVRIGIIAASMDFRVKPQDTHLPGETDHITLPALHGSLIWKTQTARQTAHFLRHGRFDREP